MQDWPWEVADADRIAEFLATYADEALSDKERFTLMEMLIQSAEDLGSARDQHLSWAEIKKLLDTHFALHAASVEYWACLDSELEDAWEVAGFMRGLLNKHKE